ncbi:sigma-70 family RNA polymerase sigma factor [bacterium]|nr:sigma-70 family RNA polymerase sigma factor [bacterium]MBU1916686.1 sigma-70 family RNA polymerase sigma factor [bacterium]
MAQDFKTTIHLVNKAKSGEDKALNLLLDRYMERILRIVRMRLGNKLRQKTESMDIVQEVMIRAIKGFDKFELKNEGAFIHWISKLIQNEISDLADYHKAQKRDMDKEYKKPKETDDKNRSVIGQTPAKSMYRPSFQIQLKEDVLHLEHALDELKEEQREIIIMRQYEGMTFNEIGDELNISEDAARMKFARSMDKLTDIMTKD